ncbi:MAG: hypothetical protein LBG46_03105 [Elusimicrobiota bacterium]|jgi:hypothetical protein|nr:hypothetical protein [Elusimicrobiota bacterium]
MFVKLTQIGHNDVYCSEPVYINFDNVAAFYKSNKDRGTAIEFSSGSNESVLSFYVRESPEEILALMDSKK